MNYDTQARTYAGAGLSVYMRQVYLWMTAALGVTAAAAVFTASNPAMLQAIFSSILFAAAGLAFDKAGIKSRLSII